MNHGSADDISATLVAQAENDCAENDPDMIGDSAAMVLVGDVYALFAYHQPAVPIEEARAQLETRDAEAELSTLIR
ncbi:MAG: hypothetical protein ACJ8J7_06880 [Sulfurifustaceae bacterium]